MDACHCDVEIKMFAGLTYLFTIFISDVEQFNSNENYEMLKTF